MTNHHRHLLAATGLAAMLLLGGCGGNDDTAPVETDVEQLSDPYAGMANMTDDYEAAPTPEPTPTPTEAPSPVAAPSPTPMADAVETPDADDHQQMLDDAAATGMTRRIDRSMPPPATPPATQEH